MQQAQRRWLWWLAVGLWIAVILGFSSNRFSADSTSRVFTPLIEWLLPGLGAETQRLVLFLIRKGAHAFEYGVLAALSHQALRASWSPWRAAGFALSLVLAVAIVDETHQRFAARRTGSATDVCIDAAGGASALLLLAGFRRRGRTAAGEDEAAE